RRRQSMDVRGNDGRKPRLAASHALSRVRPTGCRLGQEIPGCTIRSTLARATPLASLVQLVARPSALELFASRENGRSALRACRGAPSARLARPLPSLRGRVSGSWPLPLNPGKGIRPPGFPTSTLVEPLPRWGLDHFVRRGGELLQEVKAAKGVIANPEDQR